MPGEVSRLVLEFAQLSDRRGVSSRENKLTFAGIEVLDVFERSRVDAASSNLWLAPWRLLSKSALGRSSMVRPHREAAITGMATDREPR